MKRLYILLILQILFLDPSSRVDTDEVYICKGPASTRYHLKKDCSGLNNCSTEIYKVTKKEATDKGRTLCKLED